MVGVNAKDVYSCSIVGAKKLQPSQDKYSAPHYRVLQIFFIAGGMKAPFYGRSSSSLLRRPRRHVYRRTFVDLSILYSVDRGRSSLTEGNF